MDVIGQLGFLVGYNVVKEAHDQAWNGLQQTIKQAFLPAAVRGIRGMMRPRAQGTPPPPIDTSQIAGVGGRSRAAAGPAPQQLGQTHPTQAQGPVGWTGELSRPSVAGTPSPRAPAGALGGAGTQPSQGPTGALGSAAAPHYNAMAAIPGHTGGLPSFMSGQAINPTTTSSVSRLGAAAGGALGGAALDSAAGGLGSAAARAMRGARGAGGLGR